jgi:hypothetical protein
MGTMFNQFPPYQPLSLYHSTPHHLDGILVNQAINLFNRVRRFRVLTKIRDVILRRPCHLIDLQMIPPSRINGCHHGGLQAVNIDRICGTMGRIDGFDHCFRPLSDRMRDRWVSIAIARWQHIPLQPVDLIQVGECYFVKDGHHRISVACALGETTIDANITIWKVTGPLPWEKKPALQTQSLLA